ncbi:histone deacetylase family protein [Aquabacterium sp.]|uniref:histone deacetylase family protein n=1 Tax=Aquabacterium sp. TaxID=1872578 RepID=UPI002C9B2C2A|nr:histone deacetylase family protein [Aquabacterium sp.]HSW08910.1 histone deacetylase family protein [Aquabacterium sp.]
MTTLIYSHPACLEHRPGAHHPESPDRLLAVLQALQTPAFAEAQWRDAPMGTREQVLRVHTDDYVEHVEALSPSSGLRLLDAGDTVMSPGTLQAVMRCVGAACAAVDAVASGEARNAFCATRPCGHHAEADRAMGFCVFNQAAIAALHARAARGLQRVAVMDFDVHHGNGTQNSFWRDPALFYGSCHQAPFYPGTGARHETGVAHNIVNIPLSRPCGSEKFRDSMRNEMLPALRRFAPDLLIISAGFDAHHLDPLGGLDFTDDDFHWITRELMAVADESAHGRVVSVLEGGYSLEGLASGSAAHVRALMETPIGAF